MPIAFDTSGFQQHDQSNWSNPANGDQVSLTYFDQVPDLPAPLEDPERLRHDLAVITGEVGCLIEAHVVQFGGVPALFQIVKLPIPNQPTGQAFIASFTLPKATCSAVLKLQAVESGVTGVREAVLVAQIGFDQWVQPHPYAPELQGKLPFHVGDDPRFDQQFADHPLTRVRAWAHHIARTAQVDPRFGALPAFQPPQPVQQVQPQQAAEPHTPAMGIAVPPVSATDPAQAAQPLTVQPQPPAPAVGSTLTTVVPGIPFGGILPLWLGDEDVSYWRMTQPDLVLGKLAQGALSRFAILENRFRDIVALDADSSTVVLTARYRNDDGGVAADVTPLVRVSAEEAYAALTTDAIKEAFDWVGRVSYAAAERGEYVCVEPGGVSYRETPYVLMIVREVNGQWLSIVETSPLPKDAPIWRDQQTGADTDGQMLSGPASQDAIVAGGSLALYAITSWDLHWFRLALSFGPSRK